MRSLGLSLIAVASLVACTETGAHLTFSAPNGPSAAARFRVVLATPDQIPSVGNQRVAPGDHSSVTVSYFLQQTIAGADSDEIGDVDGFTVRIAPEADTTETQFIPFVMMYDASGAITGIGTYRTTDALPQPILVKRDEIDKYKLTVEATTQNDDAALELAPGEVRVVTCHHEDQTQYTSGIVWHTLAGDEYRILFPNDGGLDATGRTLDLDCDDHEVSAESSHRDCDDTRNTYHRDAEDVCDGFDTNCDGAQTLTTTCSTGLDCPNPFGPADANGVKLCNDETLQETQCQATATCGCTGLGGQNCRFCQMPIEKSLMMPTTSGRWHPCQPAIGTFATRICTDTAQCDIEVLAVRGGWKIEISATSANSFGSRAYDVGPTMLIKAKRPEGTAYELMAQTNEAVADIDLAITNAQGTTYVPLQLRLDENISATCAGTMLTCY